MIAFGPVPSRRLGRSIGINHIPPKTCTYSCVYCQVGRTSRLTITPTHFYGEDEIVSDVTRKVDDARSAGEVIDYLTFVPDGEPTLDLRLRRLIERLQPLGIRIAVITNGSLLWRPEIREALALADWVSVKVDGVREDVWRRIDRPHHGLVLARVLEGLQEFAGTFRGELATESMLVRGFNDGAAHLADLASFLGELGPRIAYLSVPTRPPAEPDVEPPPEAVITQAFQLVRAQVAHVELLIGYEGNAFAATGALAEDLLSITAVHPMREDAVQAFVSKAGGDMSAVDSLIEQGLLARTSYDGSRFYIRRLQSGASR